MSGNAAITQNWGNSYTIDAWGNLTAKTVTKCSSETLSTTVGINNRLGVGTHDAAGNLMSNGGASYTYDAENRIVTTAGVTYLYDGDGVRVKKSGGSSSPTLYWGESFTAGPIAETDLSGTLKAEYVYFPGGGGSVKRIARRDLPSGTVHYYFSDHLNSTNLVYSASGALEEDSDFYPYGGERGYTLGSGNHFKFTGKERDPESGLDYFGARYYGNSLGRFLTPDWAAQAVTVPFAEFGDPQTPNLYSYVGNNPIWRVDGDGHQTAETGCNRITGEHCPSKDGDRLQDQKKERELDPVEKVVANDFITLSNAMETANCKADPGCKSPELLPLFKPKDKQEAEEMEVVGFVLLFVPGPQEERGAVLASRGIKRGSKLWKYWTRLEEHHGLPRQMEEIFARMGLDTEKFTIRMEAWKHRMRGVGLHSKGWNRTWKKFLDSPKNRNVPAVLRQLEKMIGDFGIGGGPA